MGKRPRQAGDDLVQPLDRHGAGVDRLASRRLLAQARTRPCRRNRRAPASAGSASRSSPEDRRLRLSRPAPDAAGRRTGAARRPRRGRDRRRRRSPGRGRACRPRCRSRGSPAPPACRGARRPCRGRSSARFAGRPLSASGAMRSKCWRASTSVGAIIAACRPASTTSAIASSATTVLPEPTSPCRSRIIRFSDLRSARISSTARACAPVKANGSAASRRRAERPFGDMRPPGDRPHPGAHEQKRELVGEQLVIGEAGRASGRSDRRHRAPSGGA